MSGNPKTVIARGLIPSFWQRPVPRPGDRVLELGCGVGVASLCLATRVDAVSVTGIERQADYAALARRNALEASLPVDIVEAVTSRDLPSDLRRLSFDHVIANPPYFRAGEGTGAQDRGKDNSFREDTPLHVWLKVARARLKPRGG
jgi:tRNA1Val (adenine37-N6)-methyltransferase